MRKFYVLLVAMLLQTGALLAQQNAQGRVSDSEGNPMPGVSISVKGSPQTGTATAENGTFTLQVKSGTILLFRMIGYQTQEVTFNGQSGIVVQLKDENTNLNDVVVVGYGTTSRRNVISSITTIDSKQLENKPVTSFDQALAGKVPGVNISQSNGAPGGGLSVTVRGTGSITGGTDPLYVIDGVPLSTNNGDRFSQGNNNFNYQVNPLNSINPSDIENIQILKDAAATAIYGSRGSNGVVIITTKKGSAGAPTISFNAYGGVSSLAKKVDVMDAYQLSNYTKLARDLSWINKDPLTHKATDALSLRNIDDRYPAYMIPYINGETGLNNTDWQDEFYRKAATQNYDLSVSGGNEKTRYFISANYMDQQGIIPNSGIKKTGLRLNLETKLNDKLKYSINLAPSYIANNLARSEKNWGDEGLVIGVLMQHPQLPAYNPDGSYQVDKLFETLWSGESNVVQFQNPLALANQVDNKMDQYRLTFSNNLEYNILKNLKFKTTLGGDFSQNIRTYYRPKSLSYRTEKAPTTYFNYGSVFNSNSVNILWDNTVEYKNTFADKHDLNIVLGTSMQKETNKNTTAEGRNFATDNVRTINTAQERYSDEGQREWSLLSYFTRASYSYLGKYLLTGTLRADGSSKFGANTKWGYFPSVSAGWRISDEKFFNKGFISELKMRASYGVTGNNDIPYYGSVALLSTTGKYTFGDVVQSGLYPNTAPNENLSWETTKTIDAGLDINFAKDFSFSADYYNAHTTDLLLDVPVPSASGYSSSLQNIGAMRNQGIELMMAMNKTLSSHSNLSVSVNFSANRNKVLALGPGQKQIISNGGLTGSHITRIGNAVGEFYGYQVLGKFESAAQLGSTAQFGKQAVGDFIYQDTNGDGVVNADDRVILGNNNPDYQIGLNISYSYKNFDFSASAYTKQGFQIINTMHRYLAEAWGNNLSVYLSDAAPRPVWGVGSSTHTRASSWQIEDASFIRIRDISVGYTFGKAVTDKLSIGRLRIYTAFMNPFTWTKYSGYNPEVSSNTGSALTPGEEFGNYPVSRTSTIGLNLTF